MALEILNDPRVRAVEWRDLMHLSRWEVMHELLISLPWLAGSLYCYHLAVTQHWAWLLLGLAAAFMLFLTGLRQVHNAYHYALGISRTATEWVIFALSMVMMGSMHAVQYNHLQHHKHCMDDGDIEAMSAKMPGWKALLLGPYFPYMLHKHALKSGGRHYRKWVLFELAMNVAWIALVFGVLDILILKIHIIVMLIGQCGTAFFAVWTVHHDCDRSHYIARTLRNPLKNFISYDMFYHVEHHLYPLVPTRKLSRLARRLDEAAPELRSKIVF